MTLASADQVRLKIQDAPLRKAAQAVGDGTATTYALLHRNITSGSAFVSTSIGWSATGATFDPTGAVTFNDRISAGSAFRITYVYSTFSETEIAHFLEVGGSVVGAALEACEALMFDSTKRASWSSPDGSDYDDTAAMSQLLEIYDRLRTSQLDEGTTGGTSHSWSINQGLY